MGEGRCFWPQPAVCKPLLPGSDSPGAACAWQVSAEGRAWPGEAEHSFQTSKAGGRGRTICTYHARAGKISG